MAVTQGLRVSVEWWANAEVSERVRRKVEKLLADLAPVLNECEAHLYDVSNLAANGHAYLLPKLELNLPLYEERRSFRLRMIRLDETEIFLETKRGDAIATVTLA